MNFSYLEGKKTGHNYKKLWVHIWKFNIETSGMF